jgi:hypothetical protein
MELRISDEIDEIKRPPKQRLNEAERAEREAEEKALRNSLELKQAERADLLEKFNELDVTPYDRARAFSYSPASGQEVSVRARKVVEEIPGQPKKLSLVDEMSGKPIKEPSIDHIVPVKAIVEMKGYNKLTTLEQQALLSRADNLRMMEKGANSAKGAKGWAKWPDGRRIYGEKVWREMVVEEVRLRRVLEEKISEILRARGQTP